MSGELAVTTEPAETPPSPPALTRRGALAEMLVLIALVPFYAVIGMIAYPANESVPFTRGTIASTLHCGAFLALMLLLLRRSGDLGRLGWRPRLHDLGIALLLYPLFLSLWRHVYRLLWATGLRHAAGAADMYQLPHGPSQVLLAVVLTAFIAVWEEAFYRGYLSLRMRQAGGGLFGAVVVSTLAFGLQHSYQGALGATWAVLGGLAFALLYAWRKNLTAVIVLHFLYDLAAWGLLPAWVR